MVGYLALFVALTATAWAAPKITSKQIGKNAVKAKHIADGQVGSLEVTDNALTGTDIDESTLDGLTGDGNTTYSASSPLTVTGTTFGLQDCPADQVLKRNTVGTSWACAPDIDTNSGGTVTSVGTSGGLTGGPITDAGTVSIVDGGVNSAKLGSKAVAGDEIGAVPAVQAFGTLVDVPNNMATAVPLSGEVFDTSNMHAPAALAFSPSQAGIYEITVETDWTQGAASVPIGNRTTQVIKNGFIPLATVGMGEVGSPLVSHGVTVLAQLGIADDVRFEVFRSSSGADPDASVTASMHLVSNP